MLEEEFQGAFRRIVFAIIDGETTNNFQIFKQTLQQLLPRREPPSADLGDNRRLNANHASRQNRAPATHNPPSRAASSDERPGNFPEAAQDTHFPRTPASYQQDQSLPSGWWGHQDTPPQSGWQQGWSTHEDGADSGWQCHRHTGSAGIPTSNAQLWDTPEQWRHEPWQSHSEGEKQTPQGRKGRDGTNLGSLESFDTDIQIELMKRPSFGRTSERTWAEITRVASLCGVDYKSRVPANTMYEYNKSTLRQMTISPATHVASLTIHPRYLNWRLHGQPKKAQVGETENDSLIGWIQTVQNTFPDVMATWADTTKHLLLTELRKLHGWEIVPVPLELEPIAVMSIICTELTALGIPLTTYWLTQVRTARVCARQEQPGKKINGKDSDRQASIGGRRALVRTMPINHRKGVSSIKQIHAFLGHYGETLGAFVPNSNKSICFVSFRHRAGLDAAIQAHPNVRTLFINGQMVNIVKAEMRGDEYHTDESSRQPQHAKLWDKDKTRQSQSSDGPQHIVLRNNGNVPQQPAGNRCVFAAIAHGLPHHHNSKTLRETTIQYITEGRSKLIEGVTIEDWIQPANGAQRNRTTIDEYAATLEAGGQGGDFEGAILADMMHTQIAIFVEHDLGYMHSTTYGNESGHHRVSILRTKTTATFPSPSPASRARTQAGQVPTQGKQPRATSVSGTTKTTTTRFKTRRLAVALTPSTKIAAQTTTIRQANPLTRLLASSAIRTSSARRHASGPKWRASTAAQFAQ